MTPEVLVIDGTAKTCKGVIAGLEQGMKGLPTGSLVRAIVSDIPTRVDVRAWAERKGHRIVEERTEGIAFEFYIAKGAPVGETWIRGIPSDARGSVP